MRVYKNLFNKGFTLVELLVVIAIIAILFAVILIAINPAQRFKDSRNSRRLSDVKSIVEAATTYTADRRGAQLPDVPDYQCVGTKPATIVSDTSPVPRAHWKFDNSVSDSLGIYNGTTSETSYSNPAKLNQGLILQNPLYGVSVANTISNPTNELTAEGWIKLNQKVEPGTFDHHQTLFDKGNYRLQLNSDSGKLEFETQSGSSWVLDYDNTTISPAPNVRGVEGITQFQGNLYAGGVKENGANDSGIVLKKINGSWVADTNYPTGSKSINTLAVYNGKLYSGEGRSTSGPAMVYAFDGNTWQDTKLQDAVTVNADVLSLIRYQGKLYAGLGSLSGASAWEYDGTTWKAAKQFSASEALAVYSLAIFNEKLYAGTGRLSIDNDPRLYEFDGNSWFQKYNSTSLGARDSVYSLAVYEKYLIIGLGGNGGTDGRIFAWNGASSLTPTPIESGYNFEEKVLSFGVFNGVLYAGWSGSANNEARIFYWNKSGPYWSPSSPLLSSAEVRIIYPYKGKLYIGTLGSDGAAVMAEIQTYGSNGFLESQKSTWFPNVWYHVAGIYDGANTSMTLLVNGGINVSMSSASGSITANILPLYLGIGYASDAFSGVIDDFAIHHSVLSDTDIASHAGCYNLGQYLAPEYMGSLPIDPSSTVTDGTDTGYFISKDTSGVITITAPLTETTSSIPEIIKASR